ncbi:MerR family transcriptional regulator [Thiomicrorhabdus heinhorstiae]|uniref:MerR family transcriptional regulator n=1 Tax=Thiomicrorhabdus heinhorstiae TaxID=2748010 RepID=A0ABS0BUG2_9GAMM|nr:MerR family transcriptional regulator [Thiomicrorhabdus heinhorstiae]MBF6057480.1 MerR family transcriptional regulator [Thiomicrorhabdus heinhorstiae]
MNIKEFSQRTGISPHTIRFYEKNGVLGSVQRLANGHRWFTDKDVSWMEFVLRLKHTGMPLDKIRLYAKLRSQGKETLLQRQTLLEEHAQTLEQSIVQLHSHLQKLNDKIDLYRQNLVD